jgi:hypothetical protein
LVQIIHRQREFNFVQIKGQVLFKGDIITKISKWGGIIEKSSEEKLKFI